MDEDPVPAEQPPNQSQRVPAALTQPQAALAAVAQQGNGLAVAGFVLGITCVIFSWWGIFTLV
jgi:hypothetical protein